MKRFGYACSFLLTLALILYAAEPQIGTRKVVTSPSGKVVGTVAIWNGSDWIAGTNGSALTASGVTAGTYGNGSYTVSITVNANGIVTGITTNVINVNGGTVVVTNAISGGAVATDASVFNNLTRGTVRIAATGNFTLSNPTNPSDTEQIIFEITQDSTGSRLLTLGSKFHLGSEITAVTLTTTASKRDRFTATYHGPSDQWEITGFVRGY